MGLEAAANDAVESLLDLLGQSQSRPSSEVDADELFKSLTYAEGALEHRRAASDADGGGGALFMRLTSGLCSWLRAHEDYVDSLCVRSLLKILTRVLGEDPGAENVAIQKGLLSSVTVLLTSRASDALMAKCCLELLAILSVVESSDTILSRLGTIPLVLDLLQKHRDNSAILEDTITTLALMAKRTRHRKALLQASGLSLIVDVLKRCAGVPHVVLAVCRFVKNFAVKGDLSSMFLGSGGVEALTAAFDLHSSFRAKVEAPTLAELRVAVASAIWACTANCSAAQSAILCSGWLPSLASALRASPTDAALHEAALGILRGFARNQAYSAEIINLGLVAAALQAISVFGDHTSVKKEACGFLGNLATHPDVRVHLGICGVLGPILEILTKCQCSDDRKVAKLALGALSNLASCEENRCLLAEMQPAPVVLNAARVFMFSESILEYAIGAVSHLAVHPDCNRQLVEAGAVEALLLFLGEHRGDRDVVSKALVGLRRLLKHNTGAEGDVQQLCLLRQIAQAGGSVSANDAEGIRILVEALDAHIYDENIARETALLLTCLSRDPSLVSSLLSVAAKKCMEALEVHKNDVAAADALVGLLVRLPLEDDAQLAVASLEGSIQ